MTRSDLELIRMIRMVYPVAEKNELVNRQLVGGSKIQKFLYGLYYEATLYAYDYIEIVVFWLPLALLLTGYVVIMLCLDIGKQFVEIAEDPIYGGTREYPLDGAVWIRYQIIKLIGKTPWYRYIIKKL